MGKLTPDRLRERDSLEKLVQVGRLYCTKHDKVINRATFWQKRCYLSRTGSRCEYISITESGENLGGKK